jgi:5-methylcytosine-specific restriction enzyme subunit McrC
MYKESFISIYEDTQYKLDFSKEEVLELLKIKDIIGNNNLMLQADGTFMVKHYVGFLCSSKIKLQVLPKIINKNDNIYERNEEIENKSLELLFHMLSYSGYLNAKEIPKATDISSYGNDLLEIFIAIFINRFLKMFSFSIYRQYEINEENNSFIKGKIIFNENIRKNSYRNHLHYTRYDEFTEDTLLNRIFKSVILRLINKTKSSVNKKNLKLALTFLENVGATTLSKDIFDRYKFNRLNESYKPLFNLAKMFYFNLSPGIYKGDENTFTFLVKVNELFEEYVFKKLKNGVENKNSINVYHHRPQKYLAKCENAQTFLLIPDITIMKGNEVEAILDAKYKKLLLEEKLLVSQSDIYQMLAYSIKYNCNNIYLVYPKFLDFKCKDTDNYIKTYTIENGEKQINIKVFLFDLFDYKDIDSNIELQVDIINN